MSTYYTTITQVVRKPGAALGRLALLLGLALLLASPGARAQSGPYGNEWIVQGQPYYKVKVWLDGLYRLDANYLNQLGAGAVPPTQLQVWRRGKEVAVYQGGNSATLDNTTYLEFYGQRNDGVLDKEYYKNPRDQANPYYSFFTDTASYFITWGNRLGKRMAQPVAAGGTPHAWRLQASFRQTTVTYAEAPTSGASYLPWLEGGEGYFTSYVQGKGSGGLDSLLRAVSTAPGVPAPWLEAVVVGGSAAAHNTEVGVLLPPSKTVSRVLGAMHYNGYTYGFGRYPLQFSDIGTDGAFEVYYSVINQAKQSPYDVWRYAWWRVTAPQDNVWFSNRRLLWFQNDSLLRGPATYEIANIPATVNGYDIHDPWNVQRITPTAAQTLGSAGGLRFVFPSATESQMRRMLLADAARPQVPPPASRVVFRPIDPVKPNFVIITHPKLMGAVGTVPNAARAYANYRASTAGGRYDTLMVTAPQLYDQFHYGERSVIALRHFALWLAASAPATQTKYLLLLGKGISPGAPVAADYEGYSNFNEYNIFGANARLSTRLLGERGLDLVPVSTRSPSDNFLSSDWPHDNFVPALPTGRVVASTPQEVVNYLTKLQDYESQLDPNQPNPEAWHKSVVNLVGGESKADFAEFGGYMDKYKRRLEHPLLGAKVTTYRRSIEGSAPVGLNISKDVNAGLTLINYFGHGSTTDFDLNLGLVSDPVNNYANLHKYPVLMFNGCSAGEAFFYSTTFGTDWLLTPNKGSIGMMAETGFSYAYLLDPAQDLSDQLLFNDPAWFGRPVAEVHREVVRRLQTDGLFKGNVAGTEQLLCTEWQGDPALRLFAPAKPDLVASNAALSLAPLAPETAITATSAQFTLNIGVSNPARITRDSVEIRVTRTYPSASGRTPDVYVFNNHALKPFPQSFGRDTTYAVTLPNAGNVFGDNVFKVELDYRNKIAELDETNNTATLTYSFLKSGLTLLALNEFAITPSSTPRLVAQSNDLTGLARSYDFQVDSVATFNSRALQQTTLSAGVVASFVPKTLVPAAKRDSVVWYWRVRFTTPVGLEDKDWHLSSFRVVPKATRGGWSQSHNAQFQRNLLKNVAVAAPTNRWSFPDQQLPLELLTVGGGAPGSGPTFNQLGGYGVQTVAGSPPYIGDCGINAPNLMVVVLDQHSLQRLVVPGTYATCGLGAQTFYHFASNGDTLDNLNNSAARQAQLLSFLKSVPEGAYVALVSENRLRYAEPGLAATLQQLATLLGSKLPAQLKNGDAWALVAQKRTTGGLLLAEQGPDRTSATPTYNQRIDLSYALTTPGQAGSVTSTLIGPAQQWQTLYNTIKRETATSSYTLTLSGVDASGKATVLNANVGSQPLDLSAYPAATYPYMQLSLALADSVNRTPPQLKQWLITYKGLPEGVVRRDLVAAAVYDSVRLKSQAAYPGTLRFPVKFDNVSQESFTAPLQVQVSLINAATGLAVAGHTQLVAAPRAPAAGDSVLTFFATVDMVGQFGKFYPRVMVNPQGLGQPEQYYFNNELKLDAFTIRDNNVPPTLDVAVDGRHILNDELVSAAPVINIQLKDEDRLRHITDASYFTVFLQKVGQATATQVDLTSGQVQFSVDNTSGSLAKLTYQPGLTKPLDDGTYTLRVQGRDPSGASAATQDYQVKFQVINRSMISNVYPYPNPVTSKAKFVFTLTGNELPRNMKIQIMTLTGKVVREIFMSELGPLHIGNNLTDYAWDGTDQYGDRLANGTYLYRVALDDPNGTFSKYDTAGDRAFKNDWGKLVLLR